MVEGIVYVASPLRHEQHGKPHSRVMTWLGVYQSLTPGVDLSDTPTVRLDLDNEPQPDAVLFIEPNAGGQTHLSSDGYIEGAPELIVEVAASSTAINRGSKKQVYRRNGVLEVLQLGLRDFQINKCPVAFEAGGAGVAREAGGERIGLSSSL